MNGYEVFCTYMALKLHFTTKSYDFFKYNGKTNSCKPEYFDNRKDKYMFHKIARIVKNDKECVDYIVANFLHEPKMWTRSLCEPEAKTRYLEWLRNQESMSYRFRQELESIRDSIGIKESFISNNGELPPAVISLLNHTISIETMVILCKLSGCLGAWDRQITDTVIYPKLASKIRKYTPFVKFNPSSMEDTLKEILKEKIGQSH